MTKNGFTDAELREALSEAAWAARSGEDCLRHERIWASARGELERADDEAVLLHVAECPVCALAWRSARDLDATAQGAAAQPAAAQPTAARPVADRSAAARPVRVPRWFGAPAWAGLAAAAVVVLAIGLGIVFRPGPGRETDVIYRTQEGARIESAVEEGARLPREEFVLAWEAEPAGAHYDILVTTETLDTLVQRAGLEASEFQVPPERLAQLAAGTKVLWQVTARLPDGRLIESETFTAVIE